MIVAIAAGSALAGFAWYWERRGLKTVQTAPVQRRDLTSIVTSSGEIRPKDYVHINANAFGEIEAIYVKEGDRVRQGQVLARLEAIQATAEVQAQQAQLEAARTDVQSAEAVVQSMQASLKTSQAAVARAEAQWERSQQDYRRAQSLHEEQLISRASFEQTRAEHEVAVASLKEAEARQSQAEAQLQQALSQAAVARQRVRQAQATLERLRYALTKHAYTSPLDGVVTDLPVNVGENVVMGVQNAPGSLLMTIADLSVITAEVLVDETEIGSLRLGQSAEVIVDAFPDERFAGQVTEIGNTAVIRATGLTAAQSATSSQQAKDFKVVITLDDPGAKLRPGLSATAEIVTATRRGSLAIPLQSLTIRQRRELERQRQDGAPGAAIPRATPPQKGQQELEGVFVVRDHRAFFQPVDTGISGISDIEVIAGLREGDEIVIGNYEALRTLESGERIRIDNAASNGGIGNR